MRTFPDPPVTDPPLFALGTFWAAPRKKIRSQGTISASSPAGSPPRLRERRVPVISPPGSPRPPPRAHSPPRLCVREAPRPRPSCPTENTHNPRHPPRLPGPFKQTNKNPPRHKANPTVNFLMTSSSFKCLKGKEHCRGGEGRRGHPSPGRGRGRAGSTVARGPSVRPSCRGTGRGRELLCGGCVCRNREGGRGELKKQHS